MKDGVSSLSLDYVHVWGQNIAGEVQWCIILCDVQGSSAFFINGKTLHMLFIHHNLCLHFMQASAREEILASGGSLSHHHGGTWVMYILSPNSDHMWCMQPYYYGMIWHKG